MLTRRGFVQLSMAAIGGLAAAELFGASKTRPLGVQLYTVRQEAERNLPAVLGAIRKIGYEEVELYPGVYGHAAPELRRMIADHGLRAPSGHFDYEGLASKFDYANTLGLEFVICPMLPREMWTLDGFKKAADQFNIWGEQIRQRGMQFGFHNHNYEFRRFEETTGFETLMKNSDPKLVALEMDCYWVVQAGEDPLKMFQQYGDRIRLLHLKDRKAGFPTSQELNAAAGHFTEVGAGNIPWKNILAAAQQHGVKHMFVERDSGDVPALKSIQVSFENLQKLV